MMETRITVTRRTYITLAINNSPKQTRSGLVIPAPTLNDFCESGPICSPRLVSHERSFRRLNADYRTAMFVRREGRWFALHFEDCALMGLANHDVDTVEGTLTPVEG